MAKRTTTRKSSATKAKKPDVKILDQFDPSVLFENAISRTFDEEFAGTLTDLINYADSASSIDAADAKPSRKRKLSKDEDEITADDFVDEDEIDFEDDEDDEDEKPTRRRKSKVKADEDEDDEFFEEDEDEDDDEDEDEDEDDEDIDLTDALGELSLKELKSLAEELGVEAKGKAKLIAGLLEEDADDVLSTAEELEIELEIEEDDEDEDEEDADEADFLSETIESDKFAKTFEKVEGNWEGTLGELKEWIADGYDLKPKGKKDELATLGANLEALMETLKTAAVTKMAKFADSVELEVDIKGTRSDKTKKERYAKALCAYAVENDYFG